MNLHDDPQMKSLLESLPPDTDREQLEGTFLKRERQYHAVQDRAVALTARLAAIAENLPDASAKAQRELLAERTGLLVEQLGMPADLTVSAQRFAASLSDWLTTTLASIEVERHTAQTALAATEFVFRETTFAVDQFPPGAASPAYDAAHATWRELAGQRQPHTDKLSDLTRLETLVRGFADTAIPGKLIAGRPTDGSIRRFVDSAREAA